MSEIITSVDINFSNNGGSHTASINSVLNAVDAGGNLQLGTLNGSVGERYDFDNDELARLMQQFVAIEETQTEDSNNTISKNTKFQDIVSLKMDSHVVVVRGECASIDDQLFEGNIYKYSEHPNSPVKPAPNLGVVKSGGIFKMGRTYSVKVSSYGQEAYSIGYHNKQLELGLVYNQDVANLDPERDVLSDYSLKYGYKIADVKQALGMIGIDASGLPNSDAIFNYSGKISNVVSSIASALGYFWYINPFNGKIEFINSILAIEKTITNPLISGNRGKFTDASYTKSKLKKAFVNSFVGDFKIDQNNENTKQRDRRTYFYPIAFREFVASDVEFLAKFYGLFGSKNWSSFKYDAVFYYELYQPNGGVFENVDYVDKPQSFDFQTIDEIYSNELNYLNEVRNSNKPFGSRVGAKYFDMKINSPDGDNNATPETTVERPSSAELFTKMEGFFEMFFNNIYITRTFPKKTAERMEFNSSELNVLGPFDKTTKVKDIPELAMFAPYLQRFWKLGGDVELRGLFPAQRVITKKYDSVFIGIRPFEGTEIDLNDPENEIMKYDFISNKTVELPFNSVKSESYIGYKPTTYEKIAQASSRSTTLYVEARDIVLDNEDRLVVASYRKVARELDKEVDDDNQYVSSEGEDVSLDFERKYFNIVNNGADGNVLHPADLIIQKGFIGEIKALEAAAFRIAQLSNKPLESSSRTIYGLEIPTAETYDIVLNSISIRLNGGEGITTTIGESTRDLLPVDDEFVIGQYYKATRPHSTSPRMSAAQRNRMGI